MALIFIEQLLCAVKLTRIGFFKEKSEGDMIITPVLKMGSLRFWEDSRG